MGFDSKCDFAPPTILLGLFFALGLWCLFLVGSNILLLMVVQQQVVILEFSQEKMSTHPSTLSSCRKLTLDSFAITSMQRPSEVTDGEVKIKSFVPAFSLTSICI